jgi:hypothetical protein
MLIRKLTIEIIKVNFIKAILLGIVKTGVTLLAVLIINIFKTKEKTPKLSQIIGLKIKSNIGRSKTLNNAKVIQKTTNLSIPATNLISGRYFNP